ncbi:50S ribosomal protein L23 [Candidatus Parcubacteria bacterium]|nr:MAG: 50S ribosomal protein L23 [Candidatus Parcubacteria bacterium]
MGLFSKKTKSEDKKEELKKTKSPLKADSKKEDKPVIKKETSAVKKTSSPKNGQAHRFLLRPIISEKATIGASDGKYTFEVSYNANKVSVTKAIEEVYGVNPLSVNIINQRGKHVRFGRKFGRTKSVKRAVVTLRKGDSIKLYEGI